MNNIKKATSILYSEKVVWTMWFLAILTLFRVGAHVADLFYDNVIVLDVMYIEVAYHSSKVFILVVGIISIYSILSWFIEHGLTRKLFFKASILSASLISLTITVIAYLTTVVDNLFIDDSFINLRLNDMVLQLFSFEAFLTFMVSIILYFIIGMFISIGFYRYNWFKGLGFILIAYGLLFVESIIWGTEFFFFGFFIRNTGLDVWLALSMTLVLIGLIAIPIYQMIRTVTVKIK